jgi:hypothetical protein
MKKTKISFISYDFKPLADPQPAGRIQLKHQKKDKEGYTCEKKFHFRAIKIISAFPPWICAFCGTTQKQPRKHEDPEPSLNILNFRVFRPFLVSMYKGFE